jgi:hypothetical protein
MATFQELFDLRANADLRNKVSVAIVKKAQSLIDISVPSANQIQWANQALLDPLAMTTKLFPYVLAQNSGATVTAILAASDSAIQTSVDAAADKLINAGIF